MSKFDKFFGLESVKVAKSKVAEQTTPAAIIPLHQTFLALPNAVSNNAMPLFAPKGSILTAPDTAGLRWESKTYTSLYNQSPWVSTVIDAIVAASSKKFHLARRDGSPVDPKDEQVILSFLDAPNQFDTFLSFYGKCVQSCLLFGSVIIEFHVSQFDKEAFAQKVMKALPAALDDGYGDVANQIMQDTLNDVPEAGFPCYAAVLPMETMGVEANGSGIITGYKQFRVDGSVASFVPNEIIQVFHPKSRNLVYGDSPLDGLLDILATDALKDKRQLKIIKNETIINKFITLPAGTSQEELRKHQRALDEYYQQHGSTSDVFVMTDDMKISVINEGQHEGDFLQLSMQIRDRVCAKYFVPVGILNSEGTSSTHSEGVDSLYRGFIELAVRPVAQHIITMLNRYLMPHFGNVLGTEYVIEIDLLDDDDKADLEKTLDLTLRNGTRSINEVRAIRGQQPVEGGDTNLIYTTTGAQTLDTVLSPPIIAPEPKKPEPNLLPEVQKALLVENARQALKELRKSM